MMDDGIALARTDNRPFGPREQSVEDVSAAARGDVLFASTDERDVASARFEGAGMVVVELEGIGPSMRGRIADVIDDAIERELVARGAAGPGMTTANDRDAALSDQLFRARRLGAMGIAVILGPLRRAAGSFAALEPVDC